MPFLVARDNKTRFPGIESATTDIFSRFDEVRLFPKRHRTVYFSSPRSRFLGMLTTAQGARTPAAVALLLRDAATLLRPPLIAAVAENEEECVPPALRALSDLHDLFKPRSPRTAAKIVFYAAQVHRASASASFLLRGLQADVERWAMKLEKEEDDGERRQGLAADHEVPMTTKERGETVLDRPLIVEIS